MRQPESRLQRRIRQALELAVGGVWYKTHGGEFQEPGIGDLVGCVRGFHLEVEVKMTKGRQRASQLLRQRRIKDEGGFYEFAYSIDEAVALVGGWLINRGQTLKDFSLFQAARRGEFRLPTRERRVIYATGDRQDYYIPRRNRPLVAKTIR